MKYIARRPKAEDDYIECGETARTVHEAEHDTWSGLLDKDGNELHKQREPMGFKVK